jgi:hypothetical protein
MANVKQRKLKVPVISTSKIDFLPYPNSFAKGGSTNFPMEFMHRRNIARAKTPTSEFYDVRSPLSAGGKRTAVYQNYKNI